MAEKGPDYKKLSKQGNDAQRETKKERLKELSDNFFGRNPDHPVAGTQRWAEQQGLVEKKEEDTK